MAPVKISRLYSLFLLRQHIQYPFFFLWTNLNCVPLKQGKNSEEQKADETFSKSKTVCIVFFLVLKTIGLQLVPRINFQLV